MVAVHRLWEQTMDPVHCPDVTLFMDTFLEQQMTLVLNRVDAETE